MTTQLREGSLAFDDLLGEMTFDFFGSGQHKTTVDQLLSESDALLLDVRSLEEAQTVSMPFIHDLKLLHIPTKDVPRRIDEIPRDKPVAIVCSAGVRAAIVYAYLRTKGFDRVRILVDGYHNLVEQAKAGKLWKRMNARSR